MLCYTGITVWRVRFPFRMTFSHNLVSRSEAETLLLEVTTSAGKAGYGQVLPRSYLTGETLETALDFLANHAWPELCQISLPGTADEDSWWERIFPLFFQADAGRHNAAWAGVDVAGWDAWARSVGLTPPAGNAVPLVGVVPAFGPRKASALVGLLRWLGYRHFKVKVGQDATRDTARLAAVRRAAGKDAWLAVDANTAWDWDEAVFRMRELSRSGVQLVEEPLNAKAAAGADFARLERETGIAAMADESVCTLGDAESLILRGSPSWWNLRVAKNGGLSGYRVLAAKAREQGIPVYGGILVGETGVLAAAAREAWRDGSCSMGEYGFSRVFIKGDPFRGSPSGYRGSLAMGDSQGLGVRLQAGALDTMNAEVVFSDSRQNGGEACKKK